MKPLKQFLRFGLSAAFVIQWLASATAQVAYVNFEGKQTSPIVCRPTAHACLL